MPDSPSPAAPTLAGPGLHPTSPARCPRCGSRLGVLAATDGVRDSDDGTAPDRYCGCCGLVAPGAVRSAAAGPGPR